MQNEIPEYVDVKYDPNQYDAEECSKCKSPYFKQIAVIKKISRFELGLPEDTLHITNFYVCAKCGKRYEGTPVPQIKKEQKKKEGGFKSTPAGKLSIVKKKADKSSKSVVVDVSEKKKELKKVD